MLHLLSTCFDLHLGLRLDAQLCAADITLVTCALGATQVEQRMVNGLLALVAAERGGETVDRSLLSNLLRCFISLGTYLTAFQVALCANLPSSCFWWGGSPALFSSGSDTAMCSNAALHASCVRLTCLAAAWCLTCSHQLC